MALTIRYTVGGSARSLTLDATLVEQFQGDVEVTEHPVEDGSVVADHIRPKPHVLSIEGVVSNTPVGKTERDRLGEVKRGDLGRAHAALAELRTIKDAGQLVTIETRWGKHENLAMTSLALPRDAKTGEAIRFTASFRQVRIVTLSTVVFDRPTANPKKPSVKKRKGGQVTTPVKETSGLKKLADTAKAAISAFGG